MKRSQVLTTAVMSIPFLIVFLVFGLQFYLVKTQSLSAWILGSFGMFSTATQLNEGRLQIWLINTDGTAKLIEGALRDTRLRLVYLKAKALPSKKHIQELGRVACKLSVGDNVISVRIDYWTSDYNRSAASLSPKKGAEFVISC